MEGVVPLPMSGKDGTKHTQEQPYDSSFKAFLDDQTLAALAFFFGERVEDAQELREGLLKQDTIKPALRVDCAYLVHNQEQGTEPYVAHIEFETAPTLEIEARLLEYFALLYRKYSKPIRQVLVCPFETPNLPTPLHRITYEGKVILEHNYRVIALWKYKAQKFLERGDVRIYALLPTMQGATYEVLSQALQAMKNWHTGQESQLRNHLLWFDAFLGRTTTVNLEDKRRIRKEMNDFRSLLDEGQFVQERVAESRAEGLREGQAKGHEEGLTQDLQEGREEGYF